MQEVYRTFAEIEKKERNAPKTTSTTTTTTTTTTSKKKKTKEEKRANDSGNIWSSNEVSNPSDGFDVDRDALLDDDIDTESEAEPAEEEENDNNNGAAAHGDTIFDDDDLDDLDKQLPKVRESVRATFKYTPRLFKTPMRESTVNQEQDFIAKNRPHLHNHGLLNKDALDISETDPVWLKGKGDDFFRSGDYRSAINAYSSAFEADKTMLSALSNRAACYLKIGEPAR